MSDKRVRNLHRGELPALDALIKLLRLDSRSLGCLALEGDDLLIRSRHRLVDAVGIAQLLIGAAAAEIWRVRTDMVTDITVDTVDALHSLHTSHFTWQQGAYVEVGSEYVPLNGFHPSRDDRQILLCAGPPYMKLLNGYLDFFNCGNNRKSVDAVTARYTAEELENALADLGLPGCRAFDRHEWLAHPQGRALATRPPIEIVKIADGDPVPFQFGAKHPLDGVRVLDFTHVLAGPHSTQSLAEFGAEVLHISSPLHADTLAQHLGVDMGKYCAYLNLTDTNQLSRMHDLAATADVFASSYRGTVAERFGLTPEELASRSKNGIVTMSVNAYGYSGPWANRGGFDFNGQAASGFASAEGDSVRNPKLSPVYYLADLMSGYFAAAGMLAALLRRAREGGSYHVKVSLTRSAMWVQELGLLDDDSIAELPLKDAYPHRATIARTAFGEVATLENPLRFSRLPLPHNERLVPYGADRPEWRPQTAPAR